MLKQRKLEVFTFTNCGATGRNGPTEAQILANCHVKLPGKLTTGWKSGYPKWTVPTYGFDTGIQLRQLVQGGNPPVC